MFSETHLPVSGIDNLQISSTCTGLCLTGKLVQWESEFITLSFT